MIASPNLSVAPPLVVALAALRPVRRPAQRRGGGIIRMQKGGHTPRAR